MGIITEVLLLGFCAIMVSNPALGLTIVFLIIGVPVLTWYFIFGKGREQIEQAKREREEEQQPKDRTQKTMSRHPWMTRDDAMTFNMINDHYIYCSKNYSTRSERKRAFEDYLNNRCSKHQREIWERVQSGEDSKPKQVEASKPMTDLERCKQMFNEGV